MFRLKNRLFLSCLLIIFLLFEITVPAYEPTYVKKGDVDGNNIISEEDSRTVLKLASKIIRAESQYIKNAADPDENGKITSQDARYILLSSMGLLSLSQSDKLKNFGVTLGTTVEAPLESEQQSPSNISSVSSDISPSAAVQISTNKMYVYPDLSQLLSIKGYFIIVTYGWGHCVGMSQYGAVSMARLGCPYTQILQYYYPGAGIYAESYPATVSLRGYQVDTVEMIARIVQQEISGITYKNDPLDVNALRAQAVAAYTNMKYSGYRVQGCTYASSISACRSDVIKAAREVAGQYLTVDNKVIYAYYGALSAGVTANSKAVWNTDLSYTANVPSYWDCNEREYIGVKLFSPAQMKDFILSYDSSITLSDDPSQWLQILTHDDAVNETTGYVYSMRIGDKTIKNRAGMVFRDDVLDIAIKSPCFNIIYNGQFY